MLPAGAGGGGYDYAGANNNRDGDFHIFVNPADAGAKRKHLHAPDNSVRKRHPTNPKMRMPLFHYDDYHAGESDYEYDDYDINDSDFNYDYDSGIGGDDDHVDFG